jgi:hypothetical protein
MEALSNLIAGMPWFGWVAIVAIVMGVTYSIVLASMRHTERMEQIRQGMDPGPERD